MTYLFSFIYFLMKDFRQTKNSELGLKLNVFDVCYYLFLL